MNTILKPDQSWLRDSNRNEENVKKVFKMIQVSLTVSLACFSVSQFQSSKMKTVQGLDKGTPISIPRLNKN